MHELGVWLLLLQYYNLQGAEIAVEEAASLTLEVACHALPEI